ncbi:hypothetical protein [Leptospira sp. GIMC2001]|uniref:hypothetical protein n=1 Tax=Leptospira sp. GIMC2001 TaxID=1513297 RepID=UPI00234B5575|nr:hypothetical protein [Leptospira sp. GIMC2001]WCL48370.1 hypothetical protein O4O04_13780 [Leptospira sp. GIMC2001]
MIWFLAQYSSPYSPEYIKRIESKAENFETLFYFLLLLSIFLVFLIVYQFIRLKKLSVRSPLDNRYKTNIDSPKTKSVTPDEQSPRKATPVPKEVKVVSPINRDNHPKQSDLPDPGLIYKYSVHGDSPEKIITIGQKEGTIKTYSTEISDHHLTIMIRSINKSNSRDIYDLPDKIVEEYIIDFRRGNKIIYMLPGVTAIEEMGARMRVYIKSTPDASGDPSYADINPQQPIRFRLGDRLTQDGKFRASFFEFHFYTKDFETATKSGIPCIEKQFFLKLYKIYPGYDTASQNEDGLFPMIDPFAKA